MIFLLEVNLFLNVEIFFLLDLKSAILIEFIAKLLLVLLSDLFAILDLSMV